MYAEPACSSNVMRDRRCKNEPPVYPSPHQRADVVTILNRAIIVSAIDSCEMSESKSDNKGCQGALSCTNNPAHVDRYVAVGGLGRDDGAVAGASGRDDGAVTGARRPCVAAGRGQQNERQNSMKIKGLPRSRWVESWVARWKSRHARGNARRHSLGIRVDAGMTAWRLHGNEGRPRQIARNPNSAIDVGSVGPGWHRRSCVT